MRPRIANLSIERFRSLRQLRIDGLGRVNLITGRNNSGKSSVLEALRILASDASPTVLSPANSLLPRFGVRIMPDNQTRGILEDFLRLLVPAGSALFAHVQSSVARIRPVSAIMVMMSPGRRGAY